MLGLCWVGYTVPPGSGVGYAAVAGTGDEMVLSIYTEIPSLELQNAEVENRFHDQRFPMERVKKIGYPLPQQQNGNRKLKNIPKINKCIY